MTYTEMVFSLKSGFKKIVLTQKLILVLNQVSQKYCLHRISLYMYIIPFAKKVPANQKKTWVYKNCSLGS